MADGVATDQEREIGVVLVGELVVPVGSTRRLRIVPVVVVRQTCRNGRADGTVDIEKARAHRAVHDATRPADKPDADVVDAVHGTVVDIHRSAAEVHPVGVAVRKSGESVDDAIRYRDIEVGVRCTNAVCGSERCRPGTLDDATIKSHIRRTSLIPGLDPVPVRGAGIVRYRDLEIADSCVVRLDGNCSGMIVVVVEDVLGCVPDAIDWEIEPDDLDVAGGTGSPLIPKYYDFSDVSRPRRRAAIDREILIASDEVA